MKKKFLAVLLAVSMLAGTGLAVPGNLTVQAEENETVESKAEEKGAVDAVGDDYYDDDDDDDEPFKPEYRELADGTLEVTGNYTISGKLEKIVIPAEVDGKKVTRIGDDAFENSFDHFDDVKEIILPESITAIGSYAFKNCSSLRGVVLPDSLETIGDKAFRNCSGLSEINLPESITTIESRAFFGCSNLKEVKIPASVTYIYGNIFAGCSSLDEVQVDETNERYTSEDGVLYNKAKTKLLCYPQGKKGGNGSFTVSQDVNSIDDDAFYSCTGLSEILVAE